jgi:4-hydroxy-3-methylbut-2-enyl diphosphate reductase IspH
LHRFYFFKNDGRCSFVEKIMQADHLQSLQDKAGEQNTRYFLNLEWSSVNGKGVEKGLLDKLGLGYIDTIDKLPEGSGLYVSAYDGNRDDINRLKKNGVAVIESICPWMLALRKQLQKVSAEHQCIMMLDREHMIYRNYFTLFPENTIFVTVENYQDALGNIEIERPVHFIVYSTFREKDAREIVEYIKSRFNYEENVYWLKGICGWISRSGIFEEIQDAVCSYGLHEIWLVCSNDKNRSVKSLVYEIEESGAEIRIIKKTDDIPENHKSDKRIGILRAPIPFSRESEIIEKIMELYSE